MICQKAWPLGAGAYFSNIENFKNHLVRNHLSDFNIYVCSICACLVLSVFSSSWCLGRAAVCDCDTPWTFLLPFLWQEGFLCNTLSILFRPSWFVENLATSGQGLFSLYNLYRKLLVRNHWTDYSITRQDRSFGDPLAKLFKPSWFSKT